MSTILQAQSNPPCPKCHCKNTRKRGKRRNRLRTFQLYECPECLHRFIGRPDEHRTCPLRTILDAISTFNLGHSLTDTQRMTVFRSMANHASSSLAVRSFSPDVEWNSGGYGPSWIPLAGRWSSMAVLECAGRESQCALAREGFTSFFAARPATWRDPGSTLQPASSAGRSHPAAA